jgi:NAD(P)-dependent dehydrogenase (short-subunit alcohol dehydrogenase family)
MARVFVTGSADGLGKMAAELLIEQGHNVVLHARSAARADETRNKIIGAEDIVVGDLSSIADTKSVAEQVNKLGRFDAVIHNAGIGYREPKLVKTADGLPQLFAVNTLAPYILTAAIKMPKRLVYLSSGMHYGAGSHLDDMLWEKAALERLPSLRRNQVSRCAAGIRGGSHVSRGEVELPGTGMGPLQDGRRRRARRHRQGASDAGLVGDERRTSRDPEGTSFIRGFGMRIRLR